LPCEPTLLAANGWKDKARAEAKKLGDSKAASGRAGIDRARCSTAKAVAASPRLKR